MAEDEVKLLADAKKLPLPDRVGHANWKVRTACYEEIRDACKAVYEDTDPCLTEFASLFPKAVADTNANAVDKALEALVEFLTKANEGHVGKMCDKTCAGIVKCLGSRTSTLNKALEALVLFVELEQADKVMEHVLAGFGHKVPKVVVAAVDAVVLIVSLFGCKVIKPQPVIKALPTLLESKDNKARDKVKELVVELSRWVGPDLLRSLLFDKMRDAMKADIEAAMAEAAGMGKPKPERLTRKEAAKLAVAPAAVMEDAPAAHGAAVAAPMEIDEQADPYDFADPMPVLSELKKEFWDGLESKKWSERKASLTQLKEAARHPRLQYGDFGDVNRELRKIITKDSNVAVVAEAISCFGALSKGLRKEYAASARHLVEVFLDKFKDKNAAVGRAAAEALSLGHRYCWGLLDVQEDLVAALGHANPKVKEDTYLWLKEEIKHEAKPALSKLAPLLLPAAAASAMEAAPSLREAAMAFMAAFAIKFGNPVVLDKFTGKMDEGKKKKLDEILAEAAAAAGSSLPAAGGKAGAPAAAATAAANSAVRPLLARPRTAAVGVRASGSGPVGTRPATAGAKKAAAGPGASTGSGGGGSAAAAEADDEASLAVGALSKDDVSAQLTALLDEATVAALQDNAWKTRLDAMDKLLEKVAESGVAAANVSLLVQGMSHVPGWNDKNFQVLAKQFEVVRLAAAAASPLSKRDAFSAICGCVEKVADLKLRGPAYETLTSLAEAVGPAFVMAQLHKKAAAHTNPKVLSESLNWMACAVSEFGMGVMNVKSLLEWLKVDLASTNAAIRNSTIQLLGVMHRFLGPPLGDLIGTDVKPALMTVIEGEFAKNPLNPSHTPTRTSRVATPQRAAAAAGDSGGGKSGKGGKVVDSNVGDGGGGFDPDDLLPRQDISSQLYGDVITNMSSAKWQERKAAMDDVEHMIAAAGGRIQPQLGDLVPALKLRMTDSNKNLIIQALQLTAKLAKATGKAISRTASPLLSPGLKNLSDQKPMVRAAVVEMLDAWTAVVPASALIPELLDALTSPKTSADGRRDGMAWLAGAVTAGKGGDDVSELLKLAVVGAGDKAADVRETAGRLVAALVEVHGAGGVGAASSHFEPGQRKAALEAITKLTGAPVPIVAGMPPAAFAKSAVNPMRSSTSSLRPPSAPAALRSSTTKLPGTGAGVRSSTATLLSRSISTSGGMSGLLAQDGPLLVLDTKKDARALKGRHKPAKYQPQADEPAILEAEFSPLMSPTLRAAAFSKDFKKHCEAADLVQKSLPQGYDEVISVLDLLLRWCVLRISEANTSSLVKVLDLLRTLMDLMVERSYRLSEYEAKLLLPAVIEKSGHNQVQIKTENKELIRRVCLLHPPAKILVYIKDGFESKNNKSRVVCAEEVGAAIDRYGPSLYRGTGRSNSSPPDLLHAAAKLVTERDPALRAAVLGALEVVYAFEGDGIWAYLGKLSDQQKSLIEERLKATAARLHKAGLRPGYRAAECGQGGEDGVPDSSSIPSSPSGSNTPRRPASPALHSGIATAAGRSSSNGLGLAATGILSQAGNSQGAARGMPAGSPDAAPYTPSILATNVPATDQQPPRYRVTHTPPPNNFKASIPDDTTAEEAPAGTGPLYAIVQSKADSSLQSHDHQPLRLAGKTEEETLRNYSAAMQNLQGDDMPKAVEVMKMLCHEYMDLEQTDSFLAELFNEPRNANNLVSAVIQKIDEVFLNSTELDYRAAKYAVNLIMQASQQPRQATSLVEITLERTIKTLLLCLVDDRWKGPGEDSAGLLKALNMVVLKMLDNTNRACLCCVLIRLLRTSDPHASMPPHLEKRWLDVVVKCLIKTTKMLPQSIDTLDISSVLLSINGFFQALGPEEVRRRSAQQDTALRMVKTVLYELCKLKGTEIYQYTSGIPGHGNLDHERPVMFAYIDLNLKTVNPSLGMAPAAAIQVPAVELPATAPTSAAAAPPAPFTPTRSGIPTGGGGHHPLAPISLNTNAHANGGSRHVSQPPVMKQAVIPSVHPVESAPPNTAAPADPPFKSSAATVHPLAAATGILPPAAPLAPSDPAFMSEVADAGSARNILATIFKRIADKQHAHQALVDLYFFIEANPSVDVLDTMLNQVSPTFRNYLQRGLMKVRSAAAAQHQRAAYAAAGSAASIAYDRGSTGGASASSAALSVSASQSGGGGPGVGPHSPDAIAVASISIGGFKTGVSEEGEGQERSSGGRVGAGNMAELRSRLEVLQGNLTSTLRVSQPTATTGTMGDLQERMRKLPQSNSSRSIGGGSDA